MSVENKIDVAVVGGGIAGLMAAVGAAEQGLTVVLLEKGVVERYPCNTRYTGGAFHIGFHEIHEGENALLAAIVVDSAARRFVDEGGGVYIANCVAQLPDPLAATVVFDEAVWNGPAREHLLPANPNLVSAGGTIYKAPDLVGLAKKVGLPPEALESGVSEYNAAVDANKAQSLNPIRTTSAYKAYPIRKPPYYAIQLCAGITFTMGGLAIDGTARVLNEQNKPIPGLYAAGCATGGLEGGGYAGYIGGLAKSAVTALLAANHIAAMRRLQTPITILGKTAMGGST